MLTATALYGPVTWAVVASDGTEVSSGGGLPPGMSVSSGGVVSGTPTAVGFYSFTVRARDALGQSATALIALSVNSAP